MLIKNGALVDLETDKDFQKFLKNELPQMPNPIMFRYHRLPVKNATGQMEPPATFNILLTAGVQTNQGLEEWAYTERLQRDKTGQMYIPSKKSMMVHQGSLVLDKRDADLIYFLTKKSRQYGGTFVLEDKAQKARERVDKKAQDIEFQAAIYSKQSPLADEAMLRDVAAAFGVSDSSSKDVASLREALESKIKRNEDLRSVNPKVWGIDAFLEKINATTEMRRRAIAQKAIDQKVVKYNELSFYFELTGSGDKLLLVPTEHLRDRDNYFVTQVIKDADGGTWKIIKKSIITPEMIDSWDKPSDYGWLAEEEGLPLTMKKEEKLAKLKELYG